MTAATSNQSSTDELRDSLAQVQELLGRATPGEWKVFEDTIPWSLSNDRRGVHTQRRICTAWDHPQLRAPACITNLAFGVGLHDAATKGVQFVSMSREDGDAIIAAVNWLREHIPALLAMMEDHSPDAGKMEEDAARWRAWRELDEHAAADIAWCNAGAERDAAIDAAMRQGGGGGHG